MQICKHRNSHQSCDLIRATSLWSTFSGFQMDKGLWSKKETRQWTIALFLGTMTVYAARIALPICAVAVSKEYKWSKTDSGTVLSCFFWGYATTQVLGGWLADKYGGDTVLGFSGLFWVLITMFTPHLFYLAYLTPYPIGCLVVLRVAMGISQGFHFPCMASIVSRRLTSSEKGRVFGLVMAGSHAGTVLCGSFGSVMLDFYGWTGVFYCLGALGLLWWAYFRHLSNKSMITSRYRLNSGPSIGKDGDLEALVPNGAPENPLGSVKPLPPVPAVPWVKLFKSVHFWAAFCAHYCGANAYFTLFSWLPSYFAENYPGAKGWVFNVIPNLAVVSMALTAPWIAAKLIVKGTSVTNVRKIMEGSSLCGLAVCLFIVSTINSYQAALFFLTVAMALRGLHHGGVSVNPQDFAPNHTGAVFGILNTAAAIPGFLGVYVAGYILELTHSWSYVFVVTGVQCLIGMTIYVLYGTAKQIV